MARIYVPIKNKYDETGSLVGMLSQRVCILINALIGVQCSDVTIKKACPANEVPAVLKKLKCFVFKLPRNRIKCIYKINK